MKENTCPYCGVILNEENTEIFEDVKMCRDCFERQTVVCDDCETRIWSANSYGIGESYVCRNCYNEYFACAECGTLINSNTAHYFNDFDDEAYCQYCYERLKSRAIHNYNYKPEPEFYGNDNLFLGIELEIDEGGEFNENAEKLIRIANDTNDHIYCKHDGSLNDGFEIVSHPMTLKYHQETMNWRDVFSEAVSMNYRSHQTSTCGLHCHVNRDAFGSTYEEQEAVIARIIYFVEHHWLELLKFSRRSEYAINRWASRYGLTGNTDQTYKDAKAKHLGRYVAVNLENDNTIEFRLFRGTLRYETFIATLQLVHEICTVCIECTDHECENLSWGNFVLGIKDKPELIEFLKSRRLYVNEIVEEGSDV